MLNISQDQTLSDATLAQLATIISSKKLTSFATSHMGFKQPELENLEADYSGDAEGYNRAILIKWKNKNSAEPDIQSVINF